MLQKVLFKSASFLAVLAMLLALLPAADVHAAAVDITGTLYGVYDNGLHVTITATRTAGSAGAASCQVTIVAGGGYTNPFTISGCDDADTFTVSAADEFNRYTYYPMEDITGAGFSGVMMGVQRTFSGRIAREGGFPVVGYSLPILAGPFHFAPATNSNGIFTMYVPDFWSVTIFPDGTNGPDGYRVEGPFNWIANAPLNHDYTGLIINFRGNRLVNVGIGGSGPCKAGATVTMTPTDGGQVLTGVTNGNGDVNFNRVEPVEYDITPTKTDCTGVYLPESIISSVPITQQESNTYFNIPWLSINGQARIAGNPDISLAYWLVANFSYTVGGVTYNYQSGIEPFGGWYNIQAPFHSGTLSVTRIGGAAGLGYDPVSIPINPVYGQHDLYQDITLQPNRTITGKVLGQNDVPVFKDARLDFGSGLSWSGSGAVDGSFNINAAQPKLYYLAPNGEPIRRLETPVRALANLTALDSADVGTFIANYTRVAHDGCIRTNNNERVVLPAGGLHIRSMVGSVATYPATITENDTSMCGPGPDNQSYHFGYDVPIPYGVYGPLEVDNHLVTSSNSYRHTWDGSEINDIRVYGDRMISGKLFYAVNSDVQMDNNNFWDNLKIHDSVTNDVVNAQRDYDGRTREFQVPNLERKPYMLTFNGAMQGYDFVPNPGIPAVNSPITTDLTSGSVDLGVMYLAQHNPIAEGSRTPANGAVLPSNVFDFNWSEPPLNPNDWFTGYQLQFAPSGTTFTDTSPTPVDLPAGTSTFHVAASDDWASGTYQWRVRGNYMNSRDFGPWTALDSFTIIGAPNNVSPANGSAILTSPAAPVTFQWTTNPATMSGYKYQVQYSTSSTFSSGNTTLPSVNDPTHTATTPGALTTKTKYYWHVRVLDGSSTPVSDWSDTWNFYYNLLNPSPSLLSYVKSGGNITFTATQTNAVLPPDSQYQVQFVLSGATKPAPTPANTWTYAMPGNGVPSAPQSLSALPAGTYKWYIRIVSSGDPYNSVGYTAWVAPTTSGMVTFTAP